MKRVTRFLFMLLLLIPVCSFAQEGVKFEKYTLGEGLTLKANDNSYKVNLRGYVQTQSDSKWYEHGTDDVYTRFRLRRARMRLSGEALNSKISYRLTTDFAASLGGSDEANGMLMDAYVSYNPISNWSITVGQSSTPTDSREMALGSNTLSFVDRSKLSSAFSTIREVGVFIDGTVKVGSNSYIRPSFTLTDGDGSFTSGKRTGGLKYGARVNYLPFGRFREYGEFRESDLVRELTPKLSVGAAFSYNNATSDRRGGRTTGGQMYYDIDTVPSLPSYSKLAVDFLFKYQGLSIVGEFAQTWGSVPSDIAFWQRTNGTYSNNFNGDLDTYVKSRMILGWGYNIEASYLFPQLYLVGARYTHLRPDRNSFMKNTLYFNRNNFYEVSVSKFLSRSHAVKAQASFIYTEAGDQSRNILNGDMFNGNEMMFQALLQVSF